MNASEQFVADLCRKTFLSLWSYPNPRGKGGKELCDILVVCDPDVVIFSVKEIELKGDADDEVNAKRWRRHAVDASIKQIYGAERWIIEAKDVVRSDGTTGIPFPLATSRRVHRIAVALGGKRSVDFESRDFGKGLVHVFDEESLRIVMTELDTVADFIGYLRAKEEMLSKRQQALIQGGEEDLLALYVQHGRKFPPDANLLVLAPDYWDAIKRDPIYLSRAAANAHSDTWDQLINEVAGAVGFPVEDYENALNNVEQSLRVMARENRLSRRALSHAFIDLLQTVTDRPKFRIVRSQQTGVVYVFYWVPRTTIRKRRAELLGARCVVARGEHADATTVVGIATEQDRSSPDHSFDLCYYHSVDWTPEQQAEAGRLTSELGFGRNVARRRVEVKEYPGA